jgi:hypothetical protein
VLMDQLSLLTLEMFLENMTWSITLGRNIFYINIM